MDNRSDTDAELELFFDAARRTAPTPSAALVDRVLADARAAQRPAIVPGPRRNPVQQFFDLLGGWPAMAGFATAAAVGIWIGAGPSGALLRDTGFGPGVDETAHLVDMSPDMMFAMVEDAQ